MVYLKKTSKRILYVLCKKTNCRISDFSFCGLSGAGSRGNAGKKAAEQILRRLRKKGLVAMSENLSSGSLYYLTDEGDKVAEKIAKEIDEIKSW